MTQLATSWIKSLTAMFRCNRHSEERALERALRKEERARSLLHLSSWKSHLKKIEASHFSQSTLWVVVPVVMQTCSRVRQGTVLTLA